MSGALVVVESMFRNSREVADAIAEGLRTRITPVEVLDVVNTPARPEPGLELVVVGGARLSSPSSPCCSPGAIPDLCSTSAWECCAGHGASASSPQLRSEPTDT